MLQLYSATDEIAHKTCDVDGTYGPTITSQKQSDL